MAKHAPLKALTIDALWAWAIIHGPKRVENRIWRTKYRGPLAIHAGTTRSRDSEALESLRRLGLDPPTGDELERLRGRVLGFVELVDCVEIEPADGALFPPSLDARFAFGPWCWCLEKPIALPHPVLVRGNLKIWNLARRPILRANPGLKLP